MAALNVHDIIRNRVLVTRESARAIAPPLASLSQRGVSEIELDFLGIDGITPSFLDEVLTVISEHFDSAPGGELRILITNAPTRLSAKFAAVGRAHSLVIKELGGRSWLISPDRA